MSGDPDPGEQAGEADGISYETPEGVEVVGFDQTVAGFADLERLVQLAGTTLAGEGLTDGRLDLVAVDVDEMTQLNAEHMGKTGPTDVLSFPLDADEVIDGLDFPPGDGAPGVGPPVHLGDVIVCPEVARRQAPTHCGTEQAELSLLVIHGVLHVLGHDHAEPGETAIMQDRERHHLEAIGIVHPGAQEATC